MSNVSVLPSAPASAERPSLIERGAHGYFYLQKLKVADITARLPYIRDLCAGRSVLHVGCTDYPVFDPNHNLHIQIRDVCASLDGLDSDLAGLQRLSDYVPGDYYAAAAQVAKSYDFMLVPETIEHVHNIKDFLGELDSIDFHDVLITAPCLLGWNACFNYADYPGWRHGLLGGAGDYLEEIHPDHKAWFTPYTLANCVEQFTPWRIGQVSFLEGKRMVAVHCFK